MDENTINEQSVPSVPGPNAPTPEVGTPPQNVTVRKDAPPEQGGPGFVTLSNKSGKSMKVKVSNLRATVAEVVANNEKAAEFVKAIEANNGTVVISKRSND